MDEGYGAGAGLSEVDSTLRRLEQRLAELERELRPGAAAPPPPVLDPPPPPPLHRPPAPARPPAPPQPPATPPGDAHTARVLDEARGRITALTDQLEQLTRSREELARAADELVADHSRMSAELELARAAAARSAERSIVAIELGGPLPLPEHLPAVIPLSATVSEHGERGLVIRIDPLATDPAPRRIG